MFKFILSALMVVGCSAFAADETTGATGTTPPAADTMGAGSATTTTETKTETKEEGKMAKGKKAHGKMTKTKKTEEKKEAN